MFVHLFHLDQRFTTYLFIYSFAFSHEPKVNSIIVSFSSDNRSIIKVHGFL